MSSLEQRIADWRARLGEDPVYQSADLDELEGHLRESITVLGEKGLSAEESFWVATHRLGDAEALGGEYAKARRVGSWRRWMLWALGGHLAVLTLKGLLMTVSVCVSLLGGWFISLPYGFLAPVYPNHVVLVNAVLQVLLLVAGAYLLLAPRAAHTRAHVKRYFWGSHARRVLSLAVSLLMVGQAFGLSFLVFSVVPGGLQLLNFRLAAWIMYGSEVLLFGSFAVLVLWRAPLGRRVPAS